MCRPRLRRRAPAGTPPPSGPVRDVPGTPIGPAAPRVARYLTLDNQKWTIAPAGGGFYKIVNVGTGNALGHVRDYAGLWDDR